MRRPQTLPRPLRFRSALALALCASAVAAWSRVEGQTAPKAKGQDPDINKQFANPNADVAAFVKRFESESREVFARRDAIVGALGLKPGMAVADVGAGTGVFTRLFAEKVGPEGRVYAVDISPAFLKYIAEQAKKNGQPQVQTVRGTQDATNLPENSVDVVYICDVYHHFEKPDRSLASIRKALRPGGHLVVIDFDRVEGKSSAFVLKHIRAEKKVFVAEIRAAGFEPDPLPDPPALKENFFLRFRKPAGPDGK